MRQLQLDLRLLSFIEVFEFGINKTMAKTREAT